MLQTKNPTGRFNAIERKRDDSQSYKEHFRSSTTVRSVSFSTFKGTYSKYSPQVQKVSRRIDKIVPQGSRIGVTLIEKEIHIKRFFIEN